MAPRGVTQNLAALDRVGLTVVALGPQTSE